MKNSIFALAIATVVMASCSKSSDPTPTKVTPAPTPVTPTPTPTPITYWRISSINDNVGNQYTFNYNADGTIKSAASQYPIVFSRTTTSTTTSIVSTNLSNANYIIKATFNNSDSTLLTWNDNFININEIFNWGSNKRLINDTYSNTYSKYFYSLNKSHNVYGLDSIIDSYTKLVVTNDNELNPFRKLSPEQIIVLNQIGIGYKFLFNSLRVKELNATDLKGNFVDQSSYTYTYDTNGNITSIVGTNSNINLQFTWEKATK